MGNKEVRDILLGRIVRLDERFWTAAPPDAKFHFYGLRDGAGDVRLFGVTHLTRRYQMAEMEPDDVLAAAEKALYSMGRPVQLVSMPECKGCLYAPNWIAPVLLTVEEDADGLQMTAYTGRSLLTGRIRCHIALWILEHRLPERVTDTGKKKKEMPARAEKEPEQETSVGTETELKQETPVRTETEPKQETPVRTETEPKQETPVRTETEPKQETPVRTETEPKRETPFRIEKAPKWELFGKREIVTKREAPSRYEGKRAAPPQKKKATPKRLKK